MREHDRSGHEFRGLFTGITKHDALVAGTLFLGFLALRPSGINALSDIGGLRGQNIGNEDLVGVKNIVVVHVTDFTNRVAHDGLVVELRVGGDFTGEENAVALDQGFTGNATCGILLQASIQNAVRDKIRYFVGMAFADRLGGKDEVFAHMGV